jgi:hypothetical protein
MYKNYTNLGNFNHKLLTIFLEDGKKASPMNFLSLGSGTVIMMAAFSVTTWFPQKVSEMEHKDMLHATYTCK